MFYLQGALGVLLCLLMVPFFRLGRQEAPPGADGAALAHPLRAVGEIVDELAVFRQKADFRHAVLGMSLKRTQCAGPQFMKLRLVADKGLPETAASSLHGRIFPLYAILEWLLGGLAVDWFCRRFGSTHAMFVALVALACAPLLILSHLSVPGTQLFYVDMALLCACWRFPTAPCFRWCSTMRRRRSSRRRWALPCFSPRCR